MATRSRIGIQNEDGSVDSIYCHFDGYPEHNGDILVNHYSEREKVQKLINLGSISSLAPEVDAPALISCALSEGHSFENQIKGVTVAYHRDRDEDLQIRKSKTVEDYFMGDIEEFGYLYTLEGEWLVKDGYSSKKTQPQKVASILSGFESLISKR
jgi:hypothetical protein